MTGGTRRRVAKRAGGRAGRASILARVSGFAVLAGMAGMAGGRLTFAQAPVSPPSVAPPASTSPSPGAVPGAPAPALASPPVVLPPGTHLGAADVAIVGGNVASARERALTESLRQAVADAIATVAPEARAGQPKTVVQVLAKARSFVQRYRTREEGETGRGTYAMKIEADVDEAALRRALERDRDRAASAGQAVAAAAGASVGPPSCLLVANGPAEAAEAVFRALLGAGMKVERARDALQPAQAAEAAARAGLGAVVLVNATAISEGALRGVGLEAASCTLAMRAVTSGSGVALAEDTRSERAFAAREEDARRDCFTRAASLATPQVVPQSGGRRGATELRTIVADVAVVEPATVLTLLKQLRASGSVSAVDLRRVLPGRIEVGIRSRLTANALATALARDEAAGPLVLSAVEVSGDLLRMAVRAREAVAPVASPGPATPAAPPSRDGPAPAAPGKPITP